MSSGSKPTMDSTMENAKESAGLGSKRDSTVLEAPLLHKGGGSREYKPRGGRIRSRRDSLDPTTLANFKGSDSDVHSSSDSDTGPVSLNILLLVHESSRSRLANLLGTSGHILTIASTSGELLEACDRTSKGFDIFICHLKCFREGSAETMRWENVLAEVWKRYENVKIITLAKETHGEIPKAVRSIELGAAAFFRLPIPDEDFLQRIQTVSNFTSGTILAVDKDNAGLVAELGALNPGEPKVSTMCVSNIKQATSVIGTVEDLVCVIVAEPDGASEDAAESLSSKVLSYINSKPSIDRVPIISARSSSSKLSEIGSRNLSGASARDVRGVAKVSARCPRAEAPQHVDRKKYDSAGDGYILYAFSHKRATQSNKSREF